MKEDFIAHPYSKKGVKGWLCLVHIICNRNVKSYYSFNKDKIKAEKEMIDILISHFNRLSND